MNGKGEERLTFSDLVDTVELQKMMDLFYELTGCPIGIIDVGNNILVATGWQDICTQFHRVHPETRKKCHESDCYISNHLAEGKYIEYKCKNGLWDIACPMIIEGCHLATIFLGQFFYEGEEPERDFFIKQADKYGFDKKSYLKALDKLPVFSREKVRKTLDLDVKLANILSKQGLANLKLKKEVEARKLSELKLEKTKNYLDNVMDSMPSILIGIDFEGKIVNMNREAEKASGVSSRDAVGKPFADIFPAYSRYLDQINEAIRKRQLIEWEKLKQMQAGVPRYINVTAFPLVFDEMAGAVVRIDDVTERVRLEDMVVQTEKMMSVGGLAAGMAHEINNPLASILQSVQVMQKRVEPDMLKNRQVADSCGTSIDAIGDYLDKRGLKTMMASIQESGARAADIVKNMLNFSRQSALEPVEVDIHQLIDDTVQLASHDFDLTKKYDFKKISVERRYHRALPYVWCVKTEIEQVLFNIMKNAAQAMNEVEREGYAPKFIIRTSLEKREQKKFVRIEIKDNGPGMSEDVRKRIFDPFFTTKPVGIGTGLGLSVSYFIVTKNHRGKMAVESEAGKGTTFAISLPIETNGDHS